MKTLISTMKKLLRFLALSFISKAKLQMQVAEYHTRAVTGEPYNIPNFIVLAWTPLGFFGSYYVPQAKSEEHAVNQVREWLFRTAGVTAPWSEEYEGLGQTLKITKLEAKKLDNRTIHAV